MAISSMPSGINKPASAFAVQEEQPVLKFETVVQKTKRRRTSPQDHTILEDAYCKNPKPDKNERAQLVNQVQMGEKEVQIWFQNRRQNDRRRSRPLEPAELLTRKPLASPSAEPATSNTFEKGLASTHHMLTASHHAHPTQSLPPTTQAASTLPTLCLENERNQTSGVSAPSSVPESHGSDTPSSIVEEQKPMQARQQNATPTSSTSEEGSISGSGRKRDHAEMSRDGLLSPQASPVPQQGVATKPKGPLQRSSSVRLSMTADGAVKIRTNDDPTPSPPQERSLPPSAAAKMQAKPIRRSLSLFEGQDTQQGGVSSKPRMLNAGFGRSRDTRTWEFYCDSTSQDALSAQAEAERNGSAIGAINLIRSNSHKSRGQPMSPALCRGNTQLGTFKAKPGKPKIQRAKSSFARLQNTEDDLLSMKQANSKQNQHARLPSGDSDKENWAPGTQMSENPLRRTQPSNNRRPILQSHESAVFRDVKSHPQAVARGPLTKTSAGGDDLDCIQGLLSLSQGAWR